MKGHLHVHRPPSEVHSRAVLRCRVCAKRLGADEDRIKVHHGGGDYWVCCPSCAQKFEASPQTYLVGP